MEDKRKLCRLLAIILRQTKDFKNLEHLFYCLDDSGEWVVAKIPGKSITVNVTRVSGYRMIKRIVNAIDTGSQWEE